MCVQEDVLQREAIMIENMWEMGLPVRKMRSQLEKRRNLEVQMQYRIELLTWNWSGLDHTYIVRFVLSHWPTCSISVSIRQKGGTSAIAQIWGALREVLKPENMNAFSRHIRDRISCTSFRATDNTPYNIREKWFGAKWFAPILDDYDEERSTGLPIKCLRWYSTTDDTWYTGIWAIKGSVTELCVDYGTEEDTAVLWFGKILLLPNVTLVACEIIMDLPVIQFMKSISVLDELDRALCCMLHIAVMVYTRWDGPYREPGLVNLDAVTVDFWGLVRNGALEFIAGFIHIVLASRAVRQFTLKLHSRFERFYMIPFHRHCTHFDEMMDPTNSNEEAK